MKFSEKWLREWINPPITTEELATELTMAGLEVASVSTLAKDFSGVVVGVVAEASRHPNADKLSVCRVNVGSEEELTIVCGASNVRTGLKVAVAMLGAILPDDFQIKPVKLRGVESCGMLCSAKELGLNVESSGILELPEDAPLGMNLREYLGLDDNCIEIELTPNRGDCLSIKGIAREVAAINKMDFSLPHLSIANDRNSKHAGSDIKVSIIASDACPHYVGRTIYNINPKAKTPLSIAKKLEYSGLRCINPVVDVTNYVMLELGQPLHAFDLAKIDREISVRNAREGESLILLDGKEIQFHENNLLIADATKPLALAGVMGGLNSAVTDSTTSIFLESAFFTPEKLASTARGFKLQTDASYRFERGVDFNLQEYALNRAVALLLEIVGGELGATQEVAFEKYLPKRNPIELRLAKIEKTLGIKIATADIKLILERLGLIVGEKSECFLVTPPSYRFDISIEEDLIEEIARIYGYNLIPEQELSVALSAPKNSSDAPTRLYDLMADLGYNQVINYAFTDAKFLSLINPQIKAVEIINPIASDRSVLRTTLWCGLLNAAEYNLRRQHNRIRFFETGYVFCKPNNKVFEQDQYLSAIAIGEAFPEQWGVQKRQVDFFDLKLDLERVLKVLGVNIDTIDCQTKPHAALHPTRSAAVFVNSVLIGYIGELHPKLKQELRIVPAACLFELNLSRLNNAGATSFKNFSKFPAVTRDLAIIVANEVSWSLIRQKIIDISGHLLHSLQLFDVYCNESFGANKKSVAMHLVFQDLLRSLQDDEIDALMEKIILALKQHYGAVLRG
ncbi:MAG: phenylalanine--tRNA ligase subunit beta [Gammaproteobacteria bacterium]|nr:phenylalanine--tRNA ligase subunit beta [Gammaproteobacteria bacterium]